MQLFDTVLKMQKKHSLVTVLMIANPITLSAQKLDVPCDLNIATLRHEILDILTKTLYEVIQVLLSSLFEPLHVFVVVDR